MKPTYIFLDHELLQRGDEFFNLKELQWEPVPAHMMNRRATDAALWTRRQVADPSQPGYGERISVNGNPPALSVEERLSALEADHKRLVHNDNARGQRLRDLETRVEVLEFKHNRRLEFLESQYMRGKSAGALRPPRS